MKKLRKPLCIKCGEKRQKHFYGECKNLCKLCYSRRSRENRRKKISYYRAYDRNRSSLPKRIKLRKTVAARWKADPKLRERDKKAKREWAQRNAIKRSAHVLLWHAIRKGVVKRKPCKVCKKRKTDGHHEDYTKPLDVIWLCKKHHAARHKKIRRKKEQ